MPHEAWTRFPSCCKWGAEGCLSFQGNENRYQWQFHSLKVISFQRHITFVSHGLFSQCLGSYQQEYEAWESTVQACKHWMEVSFSIFNKAQKLPLVAVHCICSVPHPVQLIQTSCWKGGEVGKTSQGLCKHSVLRKPPHNQGRWRLNSCSYTARVKRLRDTNQVLTWVSNAHSIVQFPIFSYNLLTLTQPPHHLDFCRGYLIGLPSV